MRAYTLNEDVVSAHGKPATKNMTVYKCTGEDFGCLAEEARILGVACMAVTLDRLGNYPFFVVPVSCLDPIEVDDLPPLTKDHIDQVCKIGQGHDCCRYLTMGVGGFDCSKLHAGLRMTLDARVHGMTAQGDNCEGRSGNA